MLEKTSENDNPVYWSQGNLQGCSWLILVKGSGGASEERELVRGLTFSSSIKAFSHKFRNVTSVKVNATIYFLFNFWFMLP